MRLFCRRLHYSISSRIGLMAEEEGGKEEFLWKGISGTSHRSSSTYSRVGRVCFERQRGGGGRPPEASFGTFVASPGGQNYA